MATAVSDRRQASMPTSSTLLPSPLPSPRPRGLLPDVDSGMGGGRDEPASPRWVLRPHAVAGGKGSLAQAVRALVDERRRSRARSKRELLPGMNVTGVDKRDIMLSSCRKGSKFFSADGVIRPVVSVCQMQSSGI